MPTRVQQERAAIAQLEEQSKWLRNVRWKPDNERLTAEFDIVLGDQTIPMKIVYPVLFPDTAPSVLPLEGVRISGHQYGAGGELCLEYRPDNWEPSFTGAMMIESAHRLLTGESGADPEGRVPNVHDTTSAQDLRGQTLRLVTDLAALLILCELQAGAVEKISLIEYNYAGHWLVHLTAIGERWKRESPVRKHYKYEGTVLRVPDGVALPVGGDLERMADFLGSIGATALQAQFAAPEHDVFLMLMSNSEITLYMVDHKKKLLHVYRNLPLPDAGQRLPETHARLSECSAAIVGCGSVGSKIAVSLARSWIGKLYLFDGDLFQTGNVVRNELDNRAVGLHKADALKERVFEVAPATQVEVQRALIGGQESAGTIDLALSHISKADIVIDATANPTVHNLFGAAARRENKPFIWVEVFGGGIGGLIVRCMPNRDPVPHLARRQILAWCDNEGAPAPPSGQINYETAAAVPMIADDADVTVLAAHTTRMAIDALIRPGASIFPHSAYAIGLASGWLFTQPFDTRPIPLIADGTWGAELDDGKVEQFIDLLNEMLPGDNSGKS